MAIFQERLHRALLVCQDKFEAAKFQPSRGDTMKDLESCVDQSIQDSIEILPSLVGRLKTAFSVSD